MSKILYNPSLTVPVFVADVGVSIPSDTAYQIQASESHHWADSNDLLVLLSAGSLIVRDGTNDLSLSEGVDLIKGIFPSTVVSRIVDSTGASVLLGSKSDEYSLPVSLSVEQALVLNSLATTVATAENQGTANATLSSIDSRLITGNASLAAVDSKVSTAEKQDTANASLSSLDGKLTTANASLASIDEAATSIDDSLLSIESKLPDLGTALSIGSIPVVLATDHTPVPVRIKQRDLANKVMLRSSSIISAGKTTFKDFVVPAQNTLFVSEFSGGGLEAGYTTLYKHDPSATQVVPNGSIASVEEAAAWVRITGTMSAPSPDYSTTKAYAGSGSLRIIYSNSGTALLVRQTFATPQDFTGSRYITAHFFNDSVTGVTRTLTLILTSSGGATRTWTLAGSLGTAPFTADTWVPFKCEISNPASSSGTFDETSVTNISLRFQDSSNRSGTVYWDAIRLEDSLTLIDRIYSAFGQSFQFKYDVQDEIPAGSGLYLALTNASESPQMYSAVARGYLIQP